MMTESFSTGTERLENILLDIEDAIIEVNNIKTTSVMEWDKVSLIYKIQDAAFRLNQDTKVI